jgi:hypothetical protein
MEISWKHYSQIKMMMLRRGLLDEGSFDYQLVLRELLEILGL